MKLWKPRRDTADEDRRDQVARPSSPLPTLREFVYLDEVSVYSLTSSPDSPPASAISELCPPNLARSGARLRKSGPRCSHEQE